MKRLSVETESLSPWQSSQDIPCLASLVSLSVFTESHNRYGFGLIRVWLGQAAASLKSFSLDTGMLMSDDRKIPSGLQLKSLRLGHSARVDQHDMRNLFCDSLECLTMATLHNLGVSLADLQTQLLRVAPQLRGLGFGAPEMYISDRSGVMDALSAILSAAQRLHVLHLNVTTEDFDRLGTSVLPVSLRKIVINVEIVQRWTSTHKIYEDAMIYVADAIIKESLPSLSHLMVTSSFFRDRNDGLEKDFSVYEPSIAAAAEKDITLTFLDAFPEEAE